MNDQIFGLSRPAFSESDRPEFTMLGAHTALLTRLVFDLQSGSGIVELVIEGRTPTLPIAKYLLDQMPANCRCTCVVNPRLSQLGFLHAVCQQLAVPLPSKDYTASSLMNLIWDSLSDSKAHGETNVLIVNEADHVPTHVFKQIAELTGNAPMGEELLQVVLIGHAGLHSLLKLHDNQEVARCVTRQISLPAATEIDTARYVQMRMDQAGWQGPLPFDPGVLSRIHILSEGLPEKIDLVCDRVLRKAHALKKKKISLAVLEKTLMASNPSDAGSSAVIDALAPPSLAVASLKRWSKSRFSGFTQPGNFRRRTLPNLPSLRSAPRWLWRVLAATALAAALLIGLALTAGDAKHKGSSDAASRNETVTAPPKSASQALHSANAADATPAEASLNEDNTPTTDQKVAEAPMPSTGEQPAQPPTKDPLTSIPDFTLLKDAPDDTWPALGATWNLKLGGKAACADAMTQGHQCFRSLALDFNGLRDLNRPGLVLLEVDGARRWVQLVEADARSVTLTSGKERWQMLHSDFERIWKGAFSTLWRRPPEVAGRLYAVSADAAEGQWIDKQLKRLQAQSLIEPTADNAQARLEAFQRQQNLPGDGKAVPSTFIRVNQLIGVKEPKLFQ